MSVLGKLFGSVIEARVREFCERKGILDVSQFGFRKGKASRDGLFVLNEIIEGRGGERIFAGFMDISKAYPSVWRRGLWWKLRKLGIEGKMWRVLMSLYVKSEVGVRVGGRVDDWYEEFVGVREGCVVSPLLLRYT